MKSKSINMYAPLTINRNLVNQQKQTLRFLTNTICLLSIITLLHKNAIAQSLGINTSGAIPDSSAMLDIISPNKGLLIPRVSLSSTTDTITITNPATSLFVYNTNAAMTGGSGQGYYYYNGSMWMNFLSGTNNSLTSPLIIGGSGTTSSLTYKPTTGVGITGADHIFEVGNNGATEAMRILNNGKIGIGTSSPATELDVNGSINTIAGYRIANAATSGYYLRGNGTDFVSSAIQIGDFPSGSGNYVQNQVASDQAAGLRITGNGLFNGGQITIGTVTPSSGYLLTMNTSSGISKGLDIAMSGGSGTGVNVTSASSSHNGILVTNSSSSVSASFNGIGAVLSSTNIVSGYSGFRNSSGLSYGIYGINGTSALYATNASTWAAFLRGRTVISSEVSPTSGLGTDLEIRNTTSGAGNPSTVSLRQGTSNTTNATVLANLNFGDNHQTGPQAQIQITRGAAGGAGDLPTDMIFSTTPDASTTLTERMRILNNGNVGIGTASPTDFLNINAPGSSASNYGLTLQDNTVNAVGETVGIKFKWNTAIAADIKSILDNTSSGAAHLAFGTSDNGSSITERFRITAYGNVGIGTTSPSAKLHTLSTTEQLRLGYDASNYYSTTVTSTGGVTFDAVGAGSAFTFSDAVNLPTASAGITQALNDSTTKLATTAFVDRAISGVSGGSGWGLTGNTGTTAGTNFIGTTDANDLVFKTNNSEKLRITSSGNLGINITSPTAKIHIVAGGTTSSTYSARFRNSTDAGDLAWIRDDGAFNTLDSYWINGNKFVHSNGGTSNAFVGVYAGSSSTGGENTGIGNNALRSNTSATRNTAIGSQSLYTTTTGASNTATGAYALHFTSTGSHNTAIGEQALYYNTTGYSNTAVGFSGLWANITGSDNSAMGINSLRNNTGSYNTASGAYTLFYSTGNYNTALGYVALYTNSTGEKNTALGYGAGYSNTTGTNNTYLGSGTDCSANNLTNSTAIGYNASANANNKVRLGNSNVTVIEGQVAYTSVSDGRFKKNISEGDVKGLSFIMRLRPVVYNIDTRQFEEFLVKNKPDSVKVKHFKNKDFTASTAIRHSGFVAQEVEVAAQATNYDFGGLHKPENADDNYGLAYSEFVVPLVKAVQEQQQQLNAKDSILISLQNQINSKDVLLTTLQNQIDQLAEVIQQIQNPKKQN